MLQRLLGLHALLEFLTETTQLFGFYIFLFLSLLKVGAKSLHLALILRPNTLKQLKLRLVLFEFLSELGGSLLLFSQKLLEALHFHVSVLPGLLVHLSGALAFFHELAKLEVDTFTFGFLISEILNNLFVLLAHLSEASQSIVKTELGLFELAVQTLVLSRQLRLIQT